MCLATGPVPKCHFVLGSPEILKVGTPTLGQLWGAITLCEDLWLRWGRKQSYSPRQELSNDMWHATCTQGNRGDSWLLMVGNQIANLTLDPSFDHNLCFKCPNGSYEPILDITFQDLFNDIRNSLIQWVLILAIALQKFGNPSKF
jgi:hypothetical protein